MIFSAEFENRIHFYVEIEISAKKLIFQHHIRRDGSLKDDLNESWKLFKKLDFLVDPSAGEKKVFK